MKLGSIYQASAWGEGKIAIISDIDYKRKLLAFHECNDKGVLVRKKPVYKIYEFDEFGRSVNNELIRQPIVSCNQLYYATDWGKGVIAKIKKIYLNQKKRSVFVNSISANVRGYIKIMPIFEFEDRILPNWKLINDV